MTRWLALVGMLATQVASADDLVSSGPLAIRAPGDLVLGEATSVDLRMRPGAARVVSTTGELALVRDGDGVRATLPLPTERHPQLALVAALDSRGALVDWIAIPLAGQARIKVDTAPRAEVVVRIAGKELPAVLADRSGIATIPVLVPPGVTEALAIATAPNGNRTEKPLKLGAKPFVRTLLACTEDRAIVIAVEPDGRIATTPPRITTTIGTVALTANGGVTATFDGDATTLSTAFANEPAATCELRRSPEPPHDATFTATRRQFVAGEGPLELHAQLAFAGTRSPATVDVRFETDAGTIVTLHSFGTGWVARWTLPDAFTGRRDARAKLIATWPTGRLERTLVIALVERARGPAVPLPAPDRFAITARGGLLSNLHRVTTPMLAVVVDARLPVVHERITAGLETGGYRATVSEQDLAANVVAIPVLVRGAYRHDAGSFAMWAGAGAGLVVATTTVDSMATGRQTARTTPFAASLFAGAGYRFAFGVLVVEGGYLHATLPAGSVQGRLGGATLSFGYRREM